MIKRLLLGTILATFFLMGYGVIATADVDWPYMSRQPYRGYFLNDPDGSGADVWEPNQGPASCQGASLALPTAINTKAEFINFVMCKLSRGNQQERVGAQFIIQTMRGGSDHGYPSGSDITDWQNRVNNPDVTIDWGGSGTFRSYELNSYYQGTGSGTNPIDDAFFEDHDSSNYVIRFIYSGQVRYMIRRACANPVGELPGLPSNPAFNMSGTSRVSALGIPEAQNISVPSGTSVTFRHRLTSNAAMTQTIDWTTHTQAGTQVGSGNAGTFAAGQTKLVGQQTFPAVGPPGSQVCRYVRWNPDTQVGGTSQSAQACVTITPDFDLEPSVNIQINGGPGNRAEVGDTITFTYAVNNDGGDAPSIDCAIYGLTRNNYYPVPSPADNSSDPGYAPPPGVPGCPRDFPAGVNTNLGSENVTATTVNRTICRSLYIDPAEPGGGPLGVEACAYVVQKPYTRTYGGDVLAGFDFETAPGTCSIVDQAAVIGWNRRGGNAFAGAGAQHAVSATGLIFDMASSLGGSAGPPTALSFTNTATNSASGDFGGPFDWAPCITNFYASRPASAPGVPANVSSMSSGEYGDAGNVTLAGGTVSPGERITVYVDGDVLITGDISYAGNWSVDQLPFFRLVVQGNIYIDKDVSRVDGLYIAQPDAAGGGTIFTCADGAFAPPDLDDELLTSCDNKLTVNGSFLASDIQLLRTNGTVRQSNAAEPNTSPNIGETFNYNPLMWIPRSEASGAPLQYDSITSLPPIL